MNLRDEKARCHDSFPPLRDAHSELSRVGWGKPDRYCAMRSVGLASLHNGMVTGRFMGRPSKKEESVGLKCLRPGRASSGLAASSNRTSDEGVLRGRSAMWDSCAASSIGVADRSAYCRLQGRLTRRPDRAGMLRVHELQLDWPSGPEITIRTRDIGPMT